MYQRRKGTDSSHGSDYEKEMVTFFAIQCLASGLKDFAVCSNVDGLGAWDDVVLYTETENAEKRLNFVQLKHKLNPADKTSLLDNKTFQKYKTDYEAITQNELPSGPKCFVSSFKVKQKHMRFIFYTNTDTNNILKEINKLNYGGNIQTNNESDLMNLATNSNVDIYQLPTSGQFEKQFYLFTSQTTVLNNEIKTMIKNAMDCFNVNYLGYEDFHLKLMEEITEWIGSGRILRKSDLINMFCEITTKRFNISLNSGQTKLFWKTFVLTRVENRNGITFTKELIEMGEDFMINFHGNQVSFCSFVDIAQCVNIVKALTVQDIIQLITTELNIGTALDIPQYYINRISPRIFCRSTVLQETAENYAILASPNDFEKYKQQEKLNINCDKLQIVRNCNEIQFAHNFHILQLHPSKPLRLELLHSNTEKIASISKHVYSEDHVAKNLAEELTLNYVKKILVLADPGMGKSIFLKNLHNTLSHNRWPMFIVLNAMDYDNLNNFSSLAEWYRERLTSDLDKTVFDIYKSKGALFLLFDGYDEVHQDDVNSLNKIISDAVASNNCVLVSSRHSKREELVDLLQIHPNTLEPFDESNKRDFLENYFTSFYPEHEHLVQTFVQKILACQSLSKWSDSFSEIPLKLYMLAECFVEDCKTYLETEQFNVSHSLTIIDLYERFIDKILDRYLKEKLQLEKTALKRLRNNEKERFLVCHRNAALQLLFPQLIAKESDEDTEITLQYGLIATYYSKGVPEFIHRTFAEYLAADWFFRNKDTAEGRKVLHLLLEKYNSVVLDIFDRMVCKKCPLHLNVLDNNIEGVVRKTTEYMNRRRPTDEPLDTGQCGRCSLHLIACRAIGRNIYDMRLNIFGRDEVRLEMVHVLMENCTSWSNEPDEIFQQSPLETVMKRGAFDFADAFLKWNLVDSIPREWINNDWKKTLSDCAEYNYDKLIDKAIRALNLDAFELQTIRISIFASKTFRRLDLFQTAAARSSLGVLKTLKPYFNTLNVSNHYTEAPLWLACENGDLNTVKWLVDNGSNLFCDNYSCFTAALRNDNKDVGRYFTDYANIKKWFPNKKLDQLSLFGNYYRKNLVYKTLGTPLHAACLANNVDTIRQLIEVDGANPNTLSLEGLTPLFWAVKGNSTEALLYLLDNGANAMINVVSFDCGTALDHALHWNKTEMVALLQEKGAKTTFDVYKLTSDWYDSKNINKQLPGEFHGFYKGTALHWACALNNAELLEMLLAHPNINMNCFDKNNQMPTIWAVEGNSKEALLRLLNNGVYDRMNPIFSRMYAIDNDKIEILEFLLKNAPNMVNSIFYSDGTALDYAMNKSKKEARAVLEKWGGKTTMDIYRSTNDWHDLELINYQLPGTFFNFYSGTNLHWACALNKVELIKTLLAQKGIDAKRRDNHGQTPIFWAIKGGSLDALGLLLQHDPDAYFDTNIEKANCIYYAVKEQNTKTIKYLLNYDEEKVLQALNQIVSDHGPFLPRTCLDEAVRRGNTDIIKLLRQHGAKTMEELSKTNS